MIVGKKRIRSLKSNIKFIDPGEKIIVGIEDLEKRKNILNETGFTENLEIGESVLPKPLGPISKFNANGKDIVHRDQPMETAYTVIEWSWTELHGRNRVEQTDFRERSYKRYPRTPVSPPSVELTISTTTDGNKILISPIMEYDESNKYILHVINLFLELFGECQFFTEDLNKIIKVPIKRLNWRILPEGHIPWSRLYKELSPIIKEIPEGNQPFVNHRLQTLHNLNPDFSAVGEAGFNGYIVFGFKNKDIYIFESLFYGNATYVFDKDWKELSRKTKAEILDKNLQKERIIHKRGWENEIYNLFK